MKPSLDRLVTLVVLVLGLACAWLGPLDQQASAVVETGLKRALVSFASARAANMILSVAQSTDISAKPLGIGVSLEVGQALHPIDEVVSQFAELMLAACVAFGVMKFLIVIGAAWPVSLALTAASLWWAWLRWHGRTRHPLFGRVLILLILIRFAVPLAAVGSDAIFNTLLAGNYETAQKNLPVAGTGVWDTARDWAATPSDIPAKMQKLQQSAETWVEHMVDLIVLFLLQTLLLPLALLWMLYRILVALFDPRQVLEAGPRITINSSTVE
jgi:hypothetical protein